MKTEKKESGSRSWIPGEITENILTRLPAKSVVRLRCVCRDWQKLISHPKFVKTQLHRRRQTGEARSWLCQIHNRGVDGENSIAVGAFTKDCEAFSGDDDTSPYHSFDFGRFRGPFKVAGSCDGLLLMVDATDHGVQKMLWNPSTRQLHRLPDIPYAGCHGFGYDSSSDDYKVVALSSTRKFANVFSLKSNQWKRIGGGGHHSTADETDLTAVVHGAVHWLAKETSPPPLPHNLVITAFDFVKEEFRVMATPPLPQGVTLCSLGVIGGCLCLYESQQHGDREDHSMWLMKEYGDAASWTRTNITSPFPQINQPSDNFVVLQSLNDQHFLLLNYKRGMLVLYDKNNNTCTDIKPYGNCFLEDVILCMDTLVSPNPHPCRGY